MTTRCVGDRDGNRDISGGASCSGKATRCGGSRQRAAVRTETVTAPTGRTRQEATTRPETVTLEMAIAVVGGRQRAPMAAKYLTYAECESFMQTSYSKETI